MTMTFSARHLFLAGAASSIPAVLWEGGCARDRRVGFSRRWESSNIDGPRGRFQRMNGIWQPTVRGRGTLRLASRVRQGKPGPWIARPAGLSADGAALVMLTFWIEQILQVRWLLNLLCSPVSSTIGCLVGPVDSSP